MTQPSATTWDGVSSRPAAAPVAGSRPCSTPTALGLTCVRRGSRAKPAITAVLQALEEVGRDRRGG
ncbi:hypothetical protein [Saccharopolyspora spinosa]|uniref:hypothetical protein n=1 Tax=Saccharopolyspora spinosa TaxID=60894 RepID=UPI00117B171D|nr:hypothetical protein [Saccharopolyspora spinosa]